MKLIEQPISDPKLEGEILSLAMTNDKSAWLITEGLKTDDFFDTTNRKIFDTIAKQKIKNFDIDAVTIGTILGVEYHPFLNQILQYSIGSSNCKQYIKLLKEISIRRNIRNAALKIIDCAEQEKNSSKVEEETEKILLEVLKKDNIDDVITIRQSIYQLMAEIDRVSKGFRGPQTGLSAIDDFIDWFEAGSSYILAARPGMGKTALAVEIIDRLAIKGNEILFFSMEMSHIEISRRMAIKRTGISAKKIKYAQLTMEESSLFNLETEKVLQLPIYIIDRTDQTIQKIYNKTKQMIKKHNIKMVVLDHLGFLRSGEKTENRLNEVKLISRTLKQIAKDFKIPVLTLCQLNRNNESKGDKRPQLSDLRESGDIEQDADCVMMLYREGYYNPDHADKNIMEILFRKQRNGPTGIGKVLFYPETMTIQDIEKHGENHEGRQF